MNFELMGARLVTCTAYFPWAALPDSTVSSVPCFHFASKAPLSKSLQNGWPRSAQGGAAALACGAESGRRSTMGAGPSPGAAASAAAGNDESAGALGAGAAPSE